MFVVDAVGNDGLGTLFTMCKNVVAGPCFKCVCLRLLQRISKHLVGLFTSRRMGPAMGVVTSLVSLEYQITDSERPATYMLATISLKGLLVFLDSECSYITLFFEEFKVGVLMIRLLFFGEHRYSGRV